MNNFKKINFWISGLIIFFCFSCTEKLIKDSDEAFKNWAGEGISDSIKVINGQYWQSAHWTLEYEAFFELEANSKWIDELIRQNQLERKDKYSIPSDDIPDWFKKSEKGIIFTSDDDFLQLIVIKDTTTGHVFIYDIML